MAKVRIVLRDAPEKGEDVVDIDYKFTPSVDRDNITPAQSVALAIRMLIEDQSAKGEI